MKEIYAETERMILREFNLTDEQNLLELDSDPDVMKYLTNGVPRTIEETKQNLLKIIKMSKRYEGRFGLWAAIEKSTNFFIGWFHFRPCLKEPDNLKRIELGYRLKKKFWGKGFATEGSLILIRKGFNEFGVEEVFATTMKKNIGSQKVMKKAGLSFEKEFFHEDFPDSDELDVLYSLSRDSHDKQLF